MVTFLQQFQYQAHTEPLITTGEVISADKWIYPWSDPIQTIYRKKIVGRYLVAQAAGPIIPPMAFEIFTYDKWGYEWSTPARVKLDQRTHLVTAAQQFLAFQLTASQQPEAVQLKWYAPLSEPKRFKPALPTALNPYEFRDIANTTLPVSNPTWFNWLSEPVRLKPGLKVYLQKYDTQDTIFSPAVASLLEGFNWLSEPVRLPNGLKVYYQKAWFGPERLLPTPNVTATLNATETNSEVFEGGIYVYDSSGSTTSGQGARVSIVEVPQGGGDPVSIRES